MKFKIGDKVVMTDGNRWVNGCDYRTIVRYYNCGYILSREEYGVPNEHPSVWFDTELELYKGKINENKIKVIQVNILLDDFMIEKDFQSCAYEVDMKWDEFIESRIHPEVSIKDKVSNSTMVGVGESRSVLVNPKLILKDNFHFGILYNDLRGGFTKSLFYLVK